MGAVQCIDDDLVMGEYDDPVVGDIEICQIRIFLRSASQTVDPVREGTVGIENENPLVVGCNIEFILIFQYFRYMADQRFIRAVSSGMNLQVSIISDRTSVTTGRVVVSWMTVGMV